MRLIARDLACERGGRVVLQGVGFTVAAGEALLILGRNGVGKSSLLRLLAGLVRRTHGTVTLEGAGEEALLAEQAHYYGHLDALKPALSVAENLRFWTRYLGGPAGREADALEAVDLLPLADLPAGYLSAGQRRRLAFARLLAAPRPIWLLDEPSSALDAAAQERLATHMRAHLAGGGLLLAATHGPIGLTGARELRLGAVEASA